MSANVLVTGAVGFIEPQSRDGHAWSPELLEGRSRRALITGVTGQDGSYLAEFLLQKGYQVQIGRAHV